MMTYSEPPSPVIARIGERLLGRVESLAAELTELIKQAEPFYGAGDVVHTDDLYESVLDNLVHILSRLARRPRLGFAAANATGRRRAEQGVPLPPILRAYRVAGKFIWEALLAEARDEDTMREVVHAGSELWQIVDEHSGAVTDSYRDTVAEHARSSSQTRSAMLDVVLRGDAAGGSRLWECAAALRLPHHGTFVVAAARAPRPGVESIPQADEKLRARGVQSAWRLDVDAQVGVIVVASHTAVDKLCRHLTDLAAGPVGLSEVYSSLDQTPAALRQAQLACSAAAPAEKDIVRYERVPIAVLLVSAPDAAASVAESILGPVLALPAAERDVLLATLRLWFAEDGATSAAASKLHVHRNTVRYRLRRIEDLTGRSLSRPTGTAELHLALEATRVLNLNADQGGEQ
jgi:hypothetical protein